MILECVDRLDVVLFNGIMWNLGEDFFIDFLVDFVIDFLVFLIFVGVLIFGVGF